MDGFITENESKFFERYVKNQLIRDFSFVILMLIFSILEICIVMSVEAELDLDHYYKYASEIFCISIILFTFVFLNSLFKFTLSMHIFLELHRKTAKFFYATMCGKKVYARHSNLAYSGFMHISFREKGTAKVYKRKHVYLLDYGKDVEKDSLQLIVLRRKYFGKYCAVFI